MVVIDKKIVLFFLNEREKTWRWDGARFCLEVHVEHVDEIKIKVEMNLKMFV